MSDVVKEILNATWKIDPYILMHIQIAHTHTKICILKNCTANIYEASYYERVYYNTHYTTNKINKSMRV